jgi:Zn-finger nucleic acid-binding protein
MVELECPWCEARLRVAAADAAQEVEQTCPECLTRWLLEDGPEIELALAA